MYIIRYDVNGNDRHLSCLNSVLLTDIATPLYVTKYILFKNCKKKALYLCLRGSILLCPGPNFTESLKTCRSDHILYNNWQSRFRLVLKEQGTAEGAVVQLFWQRKAVEEAN